MVIKPLRELYEDGSNVVVANKRRITNIKNVIGNTEKLGALFNKLSYSLENDKVDDVMETLNGLYFEQLDSSTIMKLYNAYYESNDKASFISDLVYSYKLKGVKGITFAWHPVISRAN